MLTRDKISAELVNHSNNYRREGRSPYDIPP